MSRSGSDPLSEALAALAHPTRREILRRLSRFPTLHWSFLVLGLGCSRQAAARHLRVLESARLITSEPEPAWHVFELQPEGFRLIDACLGRFRHRFSQDTCHITSILAEIDEDNRDPSSCGMF